ncbi:MAG: LytR/AlgR family response regulator transcription factor [Bacteroidota bacterium]
MFQSSVDLSLAGKMVVQTGRKIHFIEIDKICYIEACNYYALIHEGDKTYVVRHTLDEFEGQLSQQHFIRIHRSIILNVNIFTCIEKIRNALFVRTSIGKEFRISRYRGKAIREKILGERKAPVDVALVGV